MKKYYKSQLYLFQPLFGMFYIACSKCGKQTVRQLWYGGGSTKNQELKRGTFKKSAASSACNADRRQLTAAPKYKI